MATETTQTTLPDIDLSLLRVQPNDTVALKMLMLIEGLFGRGVKHSIKKYDYSEQRYYQVLKDFQQQGSASLRDKKRGPKQKSRRTEKIVQQIIRYRFLDPESSSAVITQKLNQNGFSISIRSVERTIQEYGLSKKNSIH
jgi:transposase